MSLFRFTYLLFLFILLSQSLTAQDSLSVDTLQTNTAVSDSLQNELQTDGPWRYMSPIGTEEVTNDSLLRWQIWPSWSDWQAYRPGVISYRQGTIARLDAYLVSAYEPRFQKHYWQGLELNDPVSGFFNASYVPHHKLLGVDELRTTDYELNYRLTHYYSRVPVTQLNFDESKFKYRNLEFMFSRNFTAKSNLEISFWDRRDGDAFARSDIQGTQIYIKGTHQLNKKWLVHASWLNNQFEREESFGYNIGDPATFNFSRFSTVPVRNGADTEIKQSIIRTGLHRKKKDAEREDFRLSFHRKIDLRRLDNQNILSGYEITDYGANVWKRVRLGSLLKLDLGGRADHFQSDDSAAINIDTWSQFSGRVDAEIRLSERLVVNGHTNYILREDRIAHKNSAALDLKLFDFFELSGSAGFAENLPSIQSLYWNAEGFSGDENLRNEQVIHASGKAKLKLFGTTELGVEGGFRNIRDGILPTPDSTFSNIGEYNVLSLTGFMSLNSYRWELFANATIKQFSSAGNSVYEQRINNLEPIMLGRGGFYYKAPIYNSAAFLKAGLEGLISPSIVQTYSFTTETGVWNLLNDNAENAAWFRLDANISARLRSMFFVMRFENILDGFGQAGYFESVGYPMPPRRLVLGIRVLFKN